MDRITISFVIPVLNGEEYIDDCLKHIEAEMSEDDEIIVVDNGSTDRTCDMVLSHPEVRLLQFPDITIAALRNRGAEIAKGSVLAFIDSDCLVCPGWRDAVEQVLSDNQVSATGSHYCIPEHASWIERVWLSTRGSEDREADYIVSGNFAIRRNIFDRIQGFNEQWKTDEDTEIGRRLRSNGHKLLDAPAIRVIHLGNAKTIMEFYKKEKWHASTIAGALLTFQFDRPLIMTILFVLSSLAGLVLLLLSTSRLESVVLSTALIILVPIVTAIYRVAQFRKPQFFFHYFVLYFVFYIARVVALVKGLINRDKNDSI